MILLIIASCFYCYRASQLFWKWACKTRKHITVWGGQLLNAPVNLDSLKSKSVFSSSLNDQELG